MLLKCLQVVLDPGLKGGLGRGHGKSCWEAIPLRNGAREEDKLSLQGPVVGNIKEARV